MLKSVKDGILIQVNNIKEDLIDLEEKLSKNFFDKETDFILGIEDREYFSEFWEVLNKYSHKLIVMQYIKEEAVKKQTHIIKKRIRSGQRLELDGDVLLLEDLNHGAELIATGNVYVMGKAMGFIHAGSEGDETSTVIALEMRVSHLKIADVLAKNDEEHKSNFPERAFLDTNGHMAVEEVIFHSNQSFDDQENEGEKSQGVLRRLFGLKKRDIKTKEIKNKKNSKKEKKIKKKLK